MPVLHGMRAWLETPSTLKVPEYVPSSRGNVASSHIAARPGEAFSLRYDHVPVPDYDLAWKLTITGENEQNVVEQWGGPPMEMRKTQGIVKVRAMRVSEDGTRYREFAWPGDESNPSALTGKITLSLHLCHFAEATSDIPAAIAGSGPANDDTERSDQNKFAAQNHPVLAPPTTRPTSSKLWTWYWRGEEPRVVFEFKFAPREVLQEAGIIPVPNNNPLVEAARAPLKGHKPRLSTDVDVASPAGLLKYKHHLNIRNRLNWRNRGLSVSSDQSDSSVSSTEGEDMDFKF